MLIEIYFNVDVTSEENLTLDFSNYMLVRRN